MGGLTWAGAHGLGLLWRARLASSAGGWSFFSVGAFLCSGSLVPWQRTGYLKDSKDIPDGQRSPLAPSSRGFCNPGPSPTGRIVSHIIPAGTEFPAAPGQPQAPSSRSSCKLRLWGCKSHEELLEYVWEVVEARKGPCPGTCMRLLGGGCRPPSHQRDPSSRHIIAQDQNVKKPDMGATWPPSSPLPNLAQILPSQWGLLSLSHDLIMQASSPCLIPGPPYSTYPLLTQFISTFVFIFVVC